LRHLSVQTNWLALLNSSIPPSNSSAHPIAQAWDNDCLKQAQEAVQQEDWSFATQCLYQSVLQLNVAPSAATALGSDHQSVLENDIQVIRTLAFQVLEFGDFQERWDVAKVFSALGTLLTKIDGSTQTRLDTHTDHQLESLIAPLIAYLRDDEYDPELHWFVTRILSEFRESDVLTALVDLLNTSNKEDLQEMAATALAGFGAAAVPALTALLAFDRSRLLAVQTLAQIREPACVEPLMQVLHDNDSAIRAAAIAALGGTRDPRVSTLLVEALQDPVATVRQAAVTNLGFRADLLPQMDLVSVVQPFLEDENPGVGQQTAIALGRLGTSAATVALAAAAQSFQTSPVQIECIRALGWINTSAAITALHQVLGHLLASETHPDPANNLAPADLRLELIKALGRTKAADLQHQATAYLITLLQSCLPAWQTPEIKQAIALEFSNIGDSSALDPLLNLAIDPELSVKLHAIAALKQLNPTQAHQRLTAWVTDESESEFIRREAAIALQEWG